MITRCGPPVSTLNICSSSSFQTHHFHLSSHASSTRERNARARVNVTRSLCVFIPSNASVLYVSLTHTSIWTSDQKHHFIASESILCKSRANRILLIFIFWFYLPLAFDTPLNVHRHYSALSSISLSILSVSYISLSISIYRELYHCEYTLVRAHSPRWKCINGKQPLLWHRQ